MKLSDNISISSNDELTFKDLDLNRFALSLGSATSKLKFSNQIAINNAADQINTGTGTVKFSGGLTIGSGKVSANGGKISLGNASSISADGILDASSAALELNAALNVSGSGTLKTDNSTSFTLNNNALNLSGGNAASGGVLEAGGMVTLDGMTFDEKSTIKLNSDTSLSSSSPVTIKTVEMGTYSMELANATTDLTISGNLTVNPSGSAQEVGIGTGAADLTLNGVLNVQKGYISSSGGTITFGAGSNGSSFAGNYQNSGMKLTDTSLVLNTNLGTPFLRLSSNSLLQTNGNTLTPGFLDIGMGSELDFTDIATNTNTILKLSGNSGIKKTGALILKLIGIDGYTLTLNNAITSLTADNIYLSAGSPNHPNYGANTGKLLANGVNITLNKRLWVDRGKLEMGGGTLSLIQGGGLDSNGNGELDLTNSTLSLSGPFLNDGGQLTTFSSTLSLNANTLFRLGNAVVFDNYNPNGWGLLLYNNSNNTSTTTSLTLGNAGGRIILEPNANAPTSGFVQWYHDTNVEYSQQSHVIGIATNDASVNILGEIELKNDAEIDSSSGEVSIADLSLEKGEIVINGGTLSLAGGSVGANGELEIGGAGGLSLGGNLAVAGTLNLNDGASTTLAGNTIDASGGTLELAGTHSLMSITTNDQTKLQINN
ncbi:MAG: hypothetical protein VYC92_06490, partial [SAR324 cluster bacterium]|nr:hypothetical protein [SAR324 cluster bacterium]